MFGSGSFSSSGNPSILMDSDSGAFAAAADVEMRHVWVPADVHSNPKPDWVPTLTFIFILILIRICIRKCIRILTLALTQRNKLRRYDNHTYILTLTLIHTYSHTHSHLLSHTYMGKCWRSAAWWVMKLHAHSHSHFHLNLQTYALSTGKCWSISNCVFNVIFSSSVSISLEWRACGIGSGCVYSWSRVVCTAAIYRTCFKPRRVAATGKVCAWIFCLPFKLFSLILFYSVKCWSHRFAESWGVSVC